MSDMYKIFLTVFLGTSAVSADMTAKEESSLNSDRSTFTAMLKGGEKESTLATMEQRASDSLALKLDNLEKRLNKSANNPNNPAAKAFLKKITQDGVGVTDGAKKFQSDLQDLMSKTMSESQNSANTMSAISSDVFNATDSTAPSSGIKNMMKNVFETAKDWTNTATKWGKETMNTATKWGKETMQSLTQGATNGVKRLKNRMAFSDKNTADKSGDKTGASYANSGKNDPNTEINQ